MVGKKSSKAALRVEGLQKTDNNLELTSWPVTSMINQKNYYTEYLKRDDQYLAFRTLQEENTSRMVREARDKDRALAQTSNGVTIFEPNGAMDDDVAMEDVDGDESGDVQEPHGSKIIVIHPGSQNLRIGLANDALPKTVPMVIARKWKQNESEEDGGEPCPKRVKIDDEIPPDPESWFGEEFASLYNSMSSDLRLQMRNNKRRMQPNSKDQVVNYNRRSTPDTISEHNDPHRIEWTEIPSGKYAPEYITGQAALRIPEQSKPRYKLFWPIRHGWLNEKDYSQRNLLYIDLLLIIEEAIKTELGLTQKKDWKQYGCVFVIPDLYEKTYVVSILEEFMRDFEFKRVCFMQESLAASFGAGYSMACVVDVGAQKTSICCVEDGLCVEDSRMNIKYGGWDITETFIKMMLFDYFPYEEINLKRRYDYLLAEELKQKFCTMNEAEITPQLYEFHLRAAGQDTRKYMFRTYDETILAPMGYFLPKVFDFSPKLEGRRLVVDRSYDLYDGSPNDPTSAAQAVALEYTTQNIPSATIQAPEVPVPAVTIPAIPNRQQPFNLLSRLNDVETTPRSSIAGSPAPEGTPQPSRASPAPGEREGAPEIAPADPVVERIKIAEATDRILPVMPLDEAIITSIRQGARADERKMRDFFGGVMIVGGGAKIPGFNSFLEIKLREKLPGFTKEIMVGVPPRELDQQLVVWKGGSVFGRLSSSGNDSWVYQKEYEMLGSKLLAQKCMWCW